MGEILGAVFSEPIWVIFGAIVVIAAFARFGFFGALWAFVVMSLVLPYLLGALFT